MRRLIVIGLLAIAAVCSGEAQDAQVRVLGREVANKGWIVFAGHPAEIGAGRRIEEKEARGPLDLYVCRPDGSALRNLTNTEDTSEFGNRLSPDGKKMLYRRLPKEAKLNHNLWGEVGELVLARADGSGPEVLGAPGEYPWASWSPDMKQIACLYKKEGVIRIFDLQTKNPLKQMPSQGVYQQLFWSPDGKRLAGTANVAGRQWNVISLDLQSGKSTVLTRALNCTPDWFQKDHGRVIYSNRNPALFPGKYNNYGLTMLMWATVDGKTRQLIYGNASKHVYYGCTSPDDRYVIFADNPQDGFLAGDMRIVRLADTPILPPALKELRSLVPNAKEGPVFDLLLPSGISLRGFEPEWTFAPR